MDFDSQHSFQSQLHQGALIPWSSFSHFGEVIQWQIKAQSQKPAFTFCIGVIKSQVWTYEQLGQQIEKTLIEFEQKGVKAGQRILIQLPNGPDLIRYLISSFVSQVIPIVISAKAQVDAIAHQLEATWVVEEKEGASVLGSLTLPKKYSDLKLPPNVAYIQYSSGTTSRPKGIVIGDSALLKMCEQVGKRSYSHSNRVTFSWMPLYHDFGFVTMTLVPLAHGAHIVLTQPQELIRQPLYFFKLIETFEVQETAVAPFFLRLLIKECLQSQSYTQNLKSLFLIYIGGELISSLLMRDAQALLERFDLDPRVLVCGYGLAEHVVALTVQKQGEPPLVKKLKINWGDSNRETDLVSCGLPLNGAQIKVQRTDGSLADECEVGEIFFNSPMSQLGQVTNEGFSPALADTWIATGDLGVMNESELYLVGREKAVIIRGGRNINAEEIEEACRSLTLEGLRECLALGIYSESLSTENIVLLLEVMVDTQEFERKYPLDWIIAQVNQMTGEAIYDVKVLPSGALKRTTSGKLMRQYKV